MTYFKDFAPQTLGPSENVQKFGFWWGNVNLYPSRMFPHQNRASPGQNPIFWVCKQGFSSKMAKMTILVTFWPTLASQMGRQGISNRGWCQKIKCPPWTPSKFPHRIWMIWNGFRGLLVIPGQIPDFFFCDANEKEQTVMYMIIIIIVNNETMISYLLLN